jgi:hypothetical protein
MGYLSLLLASVALALADDQCPPETIGSSCTCYPGPSVGVFGTKVVCRDINDPAILLKEIQNFRGHKIDVLLLVNSDLPYLPAGLFLGTSVKEFIIKDSILDNLYSTTDYKVSPFAGLEDSLEEFAIYSTKGLSKWYYPDLKGLKHLKKIEIVQSPIDFVGHVFSEIGGGSLESITVAYSRVYRIHPQAFPELHNLKEVNFRGNFLPYMVRYMFPNPATQLRKIDLSDNKLFTLPETMFDNMPALEFLDLSQNEFKTFQPMAIYSSLKSFYISKNPFECGCHLLSLKQILSSPKLKYTDIENVECIRPGSYKRISLQHITSQEYKCH